MAHLDTIAGLFRHIALCNNAGLPGRRRRFFLGASHGGWITPELSHLLRAFPGIRETPEGIVLTPPEALPEIAAALAEAGHFAWRGEAFDVRPAPGAPVLARIDRGALPLFGMIAEGVHVNGLVRRGKELFLWIARRATNRPLDPGKLDHLVAGGIPAGLSACQTLVKEAAEEAAMPPELAQAARPVATIDYAMERPEGLRRDRLHCFDLELSEDFRPRAADGEAAGFELLPLGAVLETVATGDAFKFNVNLVLIDLFLRVNLILVPEARALRAALGAGRI